MACRAFFPPHLATAVVASPSPMAAGTVEASVRTVQLAVLLAALPVLAIPCSTTLATEALRKLGAEHAPARRSMAAWLRRKPVAAVE